MRGHSAPSKSNKSHSLVAEQMNGGVERSWYTTQKLLQDENDQSPSVHVSEKLMTSSNPIFHSAFTITINTETRTDLCGKIETDAPRVHLVDVRLPNNDFHLVCLSHGFRLEPFRVRMFKCPDIDRMIARVPRAAMSAML